MPLTQDDGIQQPGEDSSRSTTFIPIYKFGMDVKTLKICPRLWKGAWIPSKTTSISIVSKHTQIKIWKRSLQSCRSCNVSTTTRRRFFRAPRRRLTGERNGKLVNRKVRREKPREKDTINRWRFIGLFIYYTLVRIWLVSYILQIILGCNIEITF